VGEGAHQRRQLLVPARADERARRGERLCISGERAPVAAERVARELVEHDDAGERAFGCRRPGIELATQRPLDRRAEALGDAAVEVLVLDEPRLALRAMLGAAGRAEPEVEHVLRADCARSRVAHRPPPIRSTPTCTECAPSETQTASSWRFT